MAFKKVQNIEEERFGKYLRLMDDGDSVTGVFLYKDYSDVIVADCHYIKSTDFNGYAHCCGAGCPACSEGIRVQQKLFIPFLILADKSDGYDEDTVVFWDRNSRFTYQLRNQVFKDYPNPEDYVFKITRHGEHNDINTKYSISAVMNFPYDVDEILVNMNVSFKDYEYYENVVKTIDSNDMLDMLNKRESNSSKATPTSSYSYKATPRKVVPDPEDLDDVEQNTKIDSLTETYVPSVKNDTLPQYVPDDFECDNVEDDVDTSDCEPKF